MSDSLTQFQMQIHAMQIATYLGVPMLPPSKLEGLLLGQMLLHAVVGSLDQHVVEARAFQKIRRGGRHPKWIW